MFCFPHCPDFALQRSSGKLQAHRGSKIPSASSSVTAPPSSTSGHPHWMYRCESPCWREGCGEKTFPFLPISASAPTRPSRKAAAPEMVPRGKGLPAVPPPTVWTEMIIQSLCRDVGILWNFSRIHIFISIFSFFLSKTLFPPATIFLGDCT